MEGLSVQLKRPCDELQKPVQNEMQKPTPVEKMKALKDPNAPKKAKTAYMAFHCEEMHKLDKTQFPSLGERAKEVGKRWAALEDKSVYETKVKD